MTEHPNLNLVSSINKTMRRNINKQPTIKTWLRINQAADISLSNGLFQHRRVRQLQIKEALATPSRYEF